jgi:two-component system, NarL family, response regulator YdfI
VIRVIVIADSPVIRAGLSALLATNDMTVVKSVSNIDALTTTADVMLLWSDSELLADKLLSEDVGQSPIIILVDESIMTKLNASSRTEAVTLGARLGLIML